MANQNVNKVIYGGNTLIDLTADTVDAAHLLTGITAHDKSGATITGSCTYDADTSDGTASASEILVNKTAYVNAVKRTGTMPNNGAVSGEISNKAGQYTVPQGYHDGSGKVQISESEQAKITPQNIRNGISILGVLGTVTGEDELIIGSATVTPSTTQQIVLPNTQNDESYLSQVTVNAIPYEETDNAAGGKTVTIAGAA